MSIQNTRIRLLTEELLKKNLQRGILPDSQEFIWQLEQALRDAGKNDASFRFRSYRNTEVVVSSKWNQDHYRIHSDLETLYQNLSELHASLNQHYQYFDTEKGKLEKQMDVLENRLKSHIQNANRPGILPYAYDTFDDTTKVNLPACSDTFVDSENNLVRLVEERNTTRRIYPAGETRFTLYPEKLDRKEEILTGTLANTLVDKKDAVWQKQVRLKENRSLTGVWTWSFLQSQTINRVSLSFLTIKPFILQASYSPDGTEWYGLPNYIRSFEAEKQVSLDFPSIPMKFFRLEAVKQEADEIRVEGDGYDARYLFGLENIGFYKKQYPARGIFQSLPLGLLNEPENYAVQNVSLHVDEWTPTGTDIQYELALAGEGEPDWQPIDPMERKHPVHPQNLSFLRMNKNNGETLYFPTRYTDQQSEAEDLLANGIPLYRLSRMEDGKETFTLPPQKIREGSLRLFVGKNNWEITSFPSDDVYGIPALSEFEGVYPKTEIIYPELSSSRGGDVFHHHTAKEKRKYLARLSLYLDESRTITAQPVSTDPMAFYLNGELLYAGLPGSERETHFVFRPGWNEIVLLVNGQNATAVNGISLSLGFQPKNLSDTLFSRSTPLEEIALFDLQYNTKRNDRTVFSRRRVSDGWEILTNFWAPGLSFTLYYEYKAEDLPAHDQFLLRATFIREESPTVPTPLLRSYRLECT